MNSAHTLQIALQALLRNKLRSFLTMLGIIIGVFAVIATVAVGDGATARVQGLFASIGTNMLIVLPGASNQGGAFGGFGTQPTLTWDDLKAMRTEVPTVRYAAALLHKVLQVQSEDHNWNTSVNGTSPDYFAIRDWPVVQGRACSRSPIWTARPRTRSSAKPWSASCSARTSIPSAKPFASTTCPS